MCIRSLYKDYEEGGTILHREIQARVLWEVGSDGWVGVQGVRVIFIPGNRWPHQDDTALPPSSFPGPSKVPSNYIGCPRKNSPWYTLSGWTDIWSIQPPFGYKKQRTARERGGIVKVVTEEIAPFKRKGKKSLERYFSFLPNSESTQVL